MSYRRSYVKSYLSMLAALIAAVAFCACLSALPAYAEGEGDGADVPAAEQPAAAEGAEPEGGNPEPAGEDDAGAQPEGDAPAEGEADASAAEPEPQADSGQQPGQGGEPDAVAAEPGESEPGNAKQPLRAQAEGDIHPIGASCEWFIDADGCLTIRPAGDAEEGEINRSAGSTSSPWVSYRDQITSVKVIGRVCLSGSAGYFFRDFENAVNMDLTGLDTSGVTNMDFMFSECNSLVTLELSESFDTSSVTDMGSMFLNCYCLSSLDLSSFDTSNVTNMMSMFAGCRELEFLDLSSFNTASVTSGLLMFNSCSALKKISVGEDFEFKYPLGDPSGDGYTGKWTNGAGNSLTAADLKSTYDGSTMAGTWVWERDISAAEVAGLEESYPYTGSAIAPELTLTFNGEELAEGDDYELSYEDNTDRGTATVTVTGKGIYANSRAKTFTISDASATVELSPKTATYTGSVIAIGDATATDSAGADLSGEVSYAYFRDEACTQEVAASEVVGAGTYWAKASVPEVAGEHAAAESAPVKLTVNKAASKVVRTEEGVKGISLTFAGKALAVPASAFKKSGSTGNLTYAYYSDAKCSKSVKAANVKNAGAYWVKATVAADANHKAATSAAVKLVISPAKITSFKLAKTAVTYTGKPLKPKAVCKAKVAGKTVTVPATGLTVTYSRNKAVGTATATIEGKGNYTGTNTKKITFKVNPRPTALKSVSAYTIKSRAHYGNRGLKITWAAPKAECDGAEVQVLAYDAKSKSWKRVQGPYRCPTKAFGKARVKEGERFAAYTCTVGNKALKAKTKYRVQVRTYKVVAGAAYYSAWSLPKAATTSK